MGRARAAFSVSESADKKMFATRNSGKLPVIRLSDFACARERKRERERERERERRYKFSVFREARRRVPIRRGES
jgi:hypothetical protein